MTTIAELRVCEWNSYDSKLRMFRKMEQAFPEGLDGLLSLDGNTIWMNTQKTFKECMETLRMFAEKFGKYKVGYYGVHSKNELYIRYQFNDFNLYLYCREVEVALNSVGNGKCRIEESVLTPRTEYKVVCDGI